MSTGLYSGASGLALGVGLYKGVSSLWGGASGLINGFGSSFSPASLFATGEQGAWYDPSDLTTLFQDSAGTTPVTAAAQPVGLMLDKSRGLVLGPELVTNGDFSGGATGWTAGSGVTISGGAAQLAVTSFAGLSNASSLVAGATYQVSITVTNYSSGTLLFYGTGGAAANRFLVPAGNGTFTGIILSAGAGAIQIIGNPSFTGSIDNISVRELPGNHATQSNAAQRPTYGIVPAGGRRNLLTFTENLTNAVWGVASVSATVDTVTVSANVNNAIFTPTAGISVASGTFTASVELKAGTASFVTVEIWGGNSQLGARVFFNLQTGAIGSSSATAGYTVTSTNVTDAGGGWFRVSITGTAPTAVIYLASRASDTDAVYTFAAVSGKTFQMRKAQLETGSLSAYQRVVTAFDVTEAGVASRSYLSFDGSDDGMLTGNIVPGTDKAQVFAGVRKLADAGEGILLETSTTIANGSLRIYAPRSASTNYSWRAGGTALTEAASASIPAPTTNVVTGIGDIAGDSNILRINGAQSASSIADQGTGDYLAYPLYIGRRAGASLPFNGQIYGLILRFGANLSAATITQTETWLGQRVSPTVNVPLWQSKTIYDRFEDTVLDRNNETIEVR